MSISAVASDLIASGRFDDGEWLDCYWTNSKLEKTVDGNGCPPDFTLLYRV